MENLWTVVCNTKQRPQNPTSGAKQRSRKPKRVTAQQPKRVTAQQPKRVTVQQPKRVTAQQPKRRFRNPRKSRRKPSILKTITLAPRRNPNPGKPIFPYTELTETIQSMAKRGISEKQQEYIVFLVLLFTCVDGVDGGGSSRKYSPESRHIALWENYLDLSSSDLSKIIIRDNGHNRAKRCGGKLTRGKGTGYNFRCGCGGRAPPGSIGTLYQFKNMTDDPMRDVSAGHILAQDFMRKMGLMFTFNAVVTACCKCEKKRGSNANSRQTKKDIANEVRYVQHSPKHLCAMKGLLNKVGRSWELAKNVLLR
jgi:hypothetical protein